MSASILPDHVPSGSNTSHRIETDAAIGYGENQMRDMTNNRRLASIGTATAIPSILVSSIDSDEPPYPDTNIAKEAP